MTQVMEPALPTAYTPPALMPLGTLRTLTRGAGPGGEPVVMQTLLEPPFGAAAEPYQRPTLTVLGTLRSLTRGAGPGGEPMVMQTGGGIPGDLRVE
jgi:hypothetical protein